MTEIVIPNISDEEFANILGKLSEVEGSGSREAKRNIAIKASDRTSLESRVIRSTLFGTDRQKLEQVALHDVIGNNHKVFDSVI